VTARELVERFELAARLQAVVDELRLLDADAVDVPLALAEGLLEELERSLASEAES
jgi:hypothetical protein